MQRQKNTQPNNSKVYLVGSGIASLASATYLIKDAGVPGEIDEQRYAAFL